MTDAWDFYEKHWDNRAALTNAEQEILAICDLRQEVNADGFDGYFCTVGGDTAPIALQALKDVLGNDWANLLRDAITTLGDDYPLDPDARRERIDSHGLSDQLHALDERLYALEQTTDADELMTIHLRSISSE